MVGVVSKGNRSSAADVMRSQTSWEGAYARYVAFVEALMGLLRRVSFALLVALPSILYVT